MALKKIIVSQDRSAVACKRAVFPLSRKIGRTRGSYVSKCGCNNVTTAALWYTFIVGLESLPMKSGREAPKAL